MTQPAFYCTLTNETPPHVPIVHFATQEKKKSEIYKQDS